MNRRAVLHNVPKKLLLELFLQQLPTSVQTILASITPITVEKTAEVADRILKVNTPNVSLSTNAIASFSENRILQEIERLHKRIDDLTMRHFHVSGNLVFVVITESFKKGPRNAIHPAATKKIIHESSEG
ncbi:transposon Tf2-6 polyprotein [Trichonephila clavipes]|nr:transposon Tf2-6 polyprotein [Trichonephila clavipes]